MKHGILTLLCALLLLGCDTPRSPAPVADPPKPRLRAEPVTISEESTRLAAFYASVEARRLKQGLRRTDYAPADVPYGVDDLVRNFRNIALYDEYEILDVEWQPKKTVSFLRRWHSPIRLATYFGPSVSHERRQSDVREVHSYARRLSAITSVNFKFTRLENANFAVFIFNRDEMLTEPAKFAERAPRLLTPPVVANIESLADEVDCVVYSHNSGTPPFQYLGAVVVIRAEHTPMRRKSCIHEEMAQGMGLSNDAKDARPSIFNDDDEFAFLTQHDEKLLKMLYDPVLKDGMTPDTRDYIFRQAAENALKQNRI